LARQRAKLCEYARLAAGEGLTLSRRSDNASAGALRNRRYRARCQRRERIGHFTITEDLISRLIQTGEINEVAAETTQGIELGVARVLQSYTDDT